MNARSHQFVEHCSLSQLTPREREVLAHLVQHKTSKQIGLDLGIHENTVNKAIASVRAKWLTRDRYETAQVFSQLAGGVEIHPPQILPGDDDGDNPPPAFPDLPRTTEVRFSDVLFFESGDYRDVPAPEGLEALDERFGKAWRIAAIPLLALVVGMVAVCGLAIARTLTDLL